MNRRNENKILVGAPITVTNSLRLLNPSKNSENLLVEHDDIVSDALRVRVS